MTADPITLSTDHQEFLADVFARNRSRYAGWRMEAEAGGDPAGAAGAQPAGQEPQLGAQGTQQPGTGQQEPDDGGKGGKDALLADLAKERDKRQAAEQTATDLQTAQQQQLDAIAKALGLKQDEAPTAEQLAAQIADEQGKTTAAEARAVEAERRLAVFMAAPAVDANAAALLDSASFLAKLADVDATNADALAAAIKTAVDANPAFKATAPTPSFHGGARTPAAARAGTLGDAIATRMAAGTNP